MLEKCSSIRVIFVTILANHTSSCVSVAGWNVTLSCSPSYWFHPSLILSPLLPNPIQPCCSAVVMSIQPCPGEFIRGCTYITFYYFDP